MFFLKALSRPAIALLWFSQVLSAMGDYLYSIAVIWMAVQFSGSNAGLIAASEAGAQLVFGLLGGVYADRWDRRKVMVIVDIIRAGAVGLLPLLASMNMLQFWHFVVVAIIIGSLGSLFDPALQASLPIIAKDERTLRATNGLMDVTRRLARALGPSFTGLLIVFLPFSQLFTLNAISFIVSALAILTIGGRFAWKPQLGAGLTSEHVGVRGIIQEIRGAMSLVRVHKPLAWTLVLTGLINLPWSAAFVIGVPILVDTVFREGVGAVGFISGAYGVGNVLSNIVIGSITLRRRVLIIYLGKLIVGSGFVLLAFAPNVPIAMLGSALAAIGGPMGDITMHTMIQTDMPSHQLGKVYSLRMVLANVGASLGLLLAVPLFEYINVVWGIALCALFMMMCGIIGLLRFGFQEPQIHLPNSPSFPPSLPPSRSAALVAAGEVITKNGRPL